MITVIGRFDTEQAALEGLQRFIDRGWDRRVFKLVARDDLLQEHFNPEQLHDVLLDRTAAAGGGAAVGSVLGMIAGLAAMPVPGAGPLVAMGVMATTLASAATGAGVGVAIGSVLARRDPLVPVNEQPHNYGDGMRRGGALLCVRAEGRYAAEAYALLSECPGVEVWTNETPIEE